MTSLQSKARPLCRVPHGGRRGGWDPDGVGAALRRGSGKGEGEERVRGVPGESSSVENADTPGSFDSSLYPFGTPPRLPCPIPFLLAEEGTEDGVAPAFLLSVPAEPRTLEEWFWGDMTYSNRGWGRAGVIPDLWVPKRRWGGGDPGVVHVHVCVHTHWVCGGLLHEPTNAFWKPISRETHPTALSSYLSEGRRRGWDKTRNFALSP